MRITVEIGGEAYEVDVERDGPRLRVSCEGLEQEAVVGPGGVAMGGATQRVELRQDGIAWIDGSPVPFRFAGFAPGLGPGAAREGGRVPVRAMMPGRIVRLYVEPGAAVAAGTPLLVLEAMKMQNEVVSPVEGRVADLGAKEGDLVEVGRVLAYIEPPTRKG